MEKHFVTFYSPGTFVSEETTLPIKQWDEAEAVKMAGTVKERHGATPYAFRFSTRARGDNDLDSSVKKESGLYFLGGRVETLAQVAKRNDPKEAILRSNMRINGIKKIVTNTNSWKVCIPLGKRDKVIPYDPPKPDSPSP